MKATELSSILDKLHEVKTDSVLADEHADKAEAESHVVRDGKTRSTLTLTFMRGFFWVVSFFLSFCFNLQLGRSPLGCRVKKSGPG